MECVTELVYRSTVHPAVAQLQPNNCYLQTVEGNGSCNNQHRGCEPRNLRFREVGETGGGNHSTPGVSGSHDITSLATRSLRTRSYLRDTPEHLAMD